MTSVTTTQPSATAQAPVIAHSAYTAQAPAIIHSAHPRRSAPRQAKEACNKFITDHCRDNGEEERRIGWGLRCQQAKRRKIGTQKAKQGHVVVNAPASPEPQDNEGDWGFLHTEPVVPGQFVPVALVAPSAPTVATDQQDQADLFWADDESDTSGATADTAEASGSPEPSVSPAPSAAQAQPVYTPAQPVATSTASVASVLPASNSRIGSDELQHLFHELA